MKKLLNILNITMSLSIVSTIGYTALGNNNQSKVVEKQPIVIWPNNEIVKSWFEKQGRLSEIINHIKSENNIDNLSIEAEAIFSPESLIDQLWVIEVNEKLQTLTAHIHKAELDQDNLLIWVKHAEETWNVN